MFGFYKDKKLIYKNLAMIILLIVNLIGEEIHLFEIYCNHMYLLYNNQKIFLLDMILLKNVHLGLCNMGFHLIFLNDMNKNLVIFLI